MARRRNYTIIKIHFEAIKRIHLRYEDVQTRLGKSASDALNANSEAWKFRYQAELNTEKLAKISPLLAFNTGIMFTFLTLVLIRLNLSLMNK